MFTGAERHRTESLRIEQATLTTSRLPWLTRCQRRENLTEKSLFSKQECWTGFCSGSVWLWIRKEARIFGGKPGLGRSGRGWEREWERRSSSPRSGN